MRVGIEEMESEFPNHVGEHGEMGRVFPNHMGGHGEMVDPWCEV